MIFLKINKEMCTKIKDKYKIELNFYQIINI